MSDVSSSKAVTNTEIKVEQKGSSVNTTDNVVLKKDASAASDPIKADNTDVFALSEKTESSADKAQWYRDFINRTSDLSSTAKSNTTKMTQETTQRTSAFLSSMQSRMMDPMVKVQQQVYRQKQEVLDIYDKLAAIYGEKEKDIKDKLSDTFKRMVPKEYNPLEAIDASMEQKDHHKEKKLRDKEGGSDQQGEKIKELKLLKKINYKLLEIKGEILSFTGKVREKIQRRNKSIKNRLQPGYRNLKGKIVGTLEVIDEMLEEDNAE